VKEREPDTAETETPKQVTKRQSKPNGDYNPSYGATSVSRTSRGRDNKYKSRRTRRTR
jgi:hypothetical protein